MSPTIAAKVRSGQISADQQPLDWTRLKPRSQSRQKRWPVCKPAEAEPPKPLPPWPICRPDEDVRRQTSWLPSSAADAGVAVRPLPPPTPAPTPGRRFSMLGGSLDLPPRIRERGFDDD